MMPPGVEHPLERVKVLEVVHAMHPVEGLERLLPPFLALARHDEVSGIEHRGKVVARERKEVLLHEASNDGDRE
jgi:hypothetical protein